MKKKSLLQQESARSHTSATITDAIAHLRFTLLPHPAYSPDITPRDFYFFPNLKEYVRGQKFNSDEEVKAAVHWWFWEKEKTFLRMEFKNVLHVGKNILKLEKIVWKSDRAHL
jgi:histone-lysine N-methyltransferase SETMAR